MTMARKHLVDVSVTRCVRHAFLLGERPLLGEEPLNRKEWIERRLQELAEIQA